MKSGTTKQASALAGRNGVNDKYDDAGILIRPIVKLESDMDIEQLHIRMGEMAAEIERLQSVIDEANAQEPVGKVRKVAHGGPHAFQVYDNLQIGESKVYARPIPAQQSPVPRGTNEYGLDVGYIAGKLNLFLRDIDRHTPSEAARVLARLAMVADEKVLGEAEFNHKSPAGAVPDEETNFCALNSITDSQVNAVARAFWRRIYAYRNDYGIELPRPLPVEFMAHMATALTWVDREPSPRINEQDSRKIIEAVAHIGVDFGYGAFEIQPEMIEQCRSLLNKLSGDENGK